MSIDLYFFNLINGFARKWKRLDALAVFFAKYLGYLLVVFLFFAAIAQKNINIFILPVFCGSFSRFVINESVYFVYKRKRPSDVLNAKMLIKKPKYPSFPSGHTSFFFALSFALLPFSANLGIIFIVLSFLICFSRIFAGVHWPLDILAGIIAGALSAFLMLKIFKFL